jgi:hypothetical protein
MMHRFRNLATVEQQHRQTTIQREFIRAMVITCTYVRKRYDGSAQTSVYMSVHTLVWKNAVVSTASGQASDRLHLCNLLHCLTYRWCCFIMRSSLLLNIPTHVLRTV